MTVNIIQKLRYDNLFMGWLRITQRWIYARLARLTLENQMGVMSKSGVITTYRILCGVNLVTSISGLLLLNHRLKEDFGNDQICRQKFFVNHFGKRF